MREGNGCWDWGLTRHGHCDLKDQVLLKCYPVVDSGGYFVTFWSQKVRCTLRGFSQAETKIRADDFQR